MNPEQLWSSLPRSGRYRVGGLSPHGARHTQMHQCTLSTEYFCSDTSKIKNRFVVDFREHQRGSLLLPGVKPTPAKISSSIHESLVALFCLSIFIYIASMCD